MEKHEEESGLVLERVSLSIDDFQVIPETSIKFPSTESTVIMGPSGCGKSSFLKMAAGLIVPDTGRVSIFGKDIASLSEAEVEKFRKKNGFVFQDAALWQNITIYQNLALPLRFHYPDMIESEIRGRVIKMLNSVGVLNQDHLRPAQISAGERKLVSFARAIITEPDLLFLDEPTSFVDYSGTERIFSIIRSLKDTGITLIVVTTNAHLTSMIADHLLLLKEGRIIAFGKMQDIVRSRDPEVQHILSDVLSETSTFDGDILDLLSDE
jgi:ABC-type transporter Mla maintaining outer membrane lipid asymmetry ATPase subunit MlaF